MLPLVIIFQILLLLVLVGCRRWVNSMDWLTEVARLIYVEDGESADCHLEWSKGASDASSVTDRKLCAVCYRASGGRCSRCKTVQYCSGKCQIVHWRTGHKEECQSPRIDHHNPVEVLNDASTSDIHCSNPTDSSVPAVEVTKVEPAKLPSAKNEEFASIPQVNKVEAAKLSSSNYEEEEGPKTSSLNVSNADLITESHQDCDCIDIDVGSSSLSTESQDQVKPSNVVLNETSSKVHSTEVSDGGSEFMCVIPNGKSNMEMSKKRTNKNSKSSKNLWHCPFNSSSSGFEKDKMHFPYDQFVKLCKSDKVSLHPCGLINCGNSCYANVVLQCLIFTHPLSAYLLEGLHTKSCQKKAWCFTCEFEYLVMKVKQGKSPISPVGIISHINNIGKNLSQGEEEDAHEFLRHVIDAMQSECLNDCGPNEVDRIAEETTFVQLMFGGYLRSKVKCTRCCGKSKRSERIMDLSVEIYGGTCNLEEALAGFTNTEILDGENKYFCGSCKSYERAKKKLTILEAPNVLTIALKRYQATSGTFGKINKTVHFPEFLNLAPYMKGIEDKSPVYGLYAVVVHLESRNPFVSAAHYICYVKCAQGKWFKINDSVVKPVELQKVLTKDAYLLFYARCCPRAPSLTRKALPEDHWKN